MREFYQQIITNLYIYCGNRQVEKMEDTDITILLNILENVSKRFSYIPEDDQKKIILYCLETDVTYQNINVRLISNWLMLNGKKWFKEEAHTPIEANSEPVEGEARDKWIQVYLEALANTDNALTKPGELPKHKGNGSKMREQLEANGLTHEKKVSALEAACGVTNEMKNGIKKEMKANDNLTP